MHDDDVGAFAEAVVDDVTVELFPVGGGVLAPSSPSEVQPALVERDENNKTDSSDVALTRLALIP